MTEPPKYKVVCISMNPQAIQSADNLVQEFRRRGWYNMNRSKLLRFLVKNFDSEKFFQENTVPTVLDT